MAAAASSMQGSAELLKVPPSEWPATVHFSTADVDEADRLPFFREILGRQVMRQEFDPLPDHPFHTDATMRRLPGLFIYWTTSSARHIRRTRELLSDGSDNLLFQCGSGVRRVEHLGRESSLGPGDGIVFSCAEPRSLLVHSDYHTISLSVPRSALGFRLRDMDACLARPLPGEAGTHQLLLGYLELLRQESSTATPALREVAVNHVYDLLALALGATREATEIARKRGLRAAQLAAIKRSIAESLPRITLADITARHRLRSRYVQTLFQDEGTTFTQFVTEERLALARRLLQSPRSAGRKIADIAFSCGFGDISYFNRTFRQRFGASPSELRRG